MDALTNVVGILLLILIVSSLGISAAVKKIVENLPEVTQEELEAMKVSRDKTLKNLQELQIIKANTKDNLPTEEEQALITAELEEIEKNSFVLTPGRYVGAADQEEDDEPFDQKMKRLTTLLKQQQEEGAKLDQQIAENLRRIGYEF